MSHYTFLAGFFNINLLKSESVEETGGKCDSQCCETHKEEHCFSEMRVSGKKRVIIMNRLLCLRISGKRTIFL